MGMFVNTAKSQVNSISNRSGNTIIAHNVIQPLVGGTYAANGWRNLATSNFTNILTKGNYILLYDAMFGGPSTDSAEYVITMRLLYIVNGGTAVEPNYYRITSTSLYNNGTSIQGVYPFVIPEEQTVEFYVQCYANFDFATIYHSFSLIRICSDYNYRMIT